MTIRTITESLLSWAYSRIRNLESRIALRVYWTQASGQAIRPPVLGSVPELSPHVPQADWVGIGAGVTGTGDGVGLVVGAGTVPPPVSAGGVATGCGVAAAFVVA